MYHYRLTCDIWGMEPGFGLVETAMGYTPLVADTSEYFTAETDAEALKTAAKLIGKYRWTAWKQDADGYERNRTAQDFQTSWMRVERVD